MNSFLAVFPGKMTNVRFRAPMAHFHQPRLDYYYLEGVS
jgi:hypothetical protein